MDVVNTKTQHIKVFEKSKETIEIRTKVWFLSSMVMLGVIPSPPRARFDTEV